MKLDQVPEGHGFDPNCRNSLFTNVVVPWGAAQHRGSVPASHSAAHGLYLGSAAIFSSDNTAQFMNSIERSNLSSAKVKDFADAVGGKGLDKHYQKIVVP